MQREGNSVCTMFINRIAHEDGLSTEPCMKGLFQVTCLLVSDVTKLLEDEEKQFSDWEARYAFAADFKSTLEVCLLSANGLHIPSCAVVKFNTAGCYM